MYTFSPLCGIIIPKWLSCPLYRHNRFAPSGQPAAMPLFPCNCGITVTRRHDATGCCSPPGSSAKIGFMCACALWEDRRCAAFLLRQDTEKQSGNAAKSRLFSRRGRAGKSGRNRLAFVRSLPIRKALCPYIFLSTSIFNLRSAIKKTWQKN